MSFEPARRALTEDVALRPLPVPVVALLEALRAPPRLAAASGQEPWEVFLALDDELDRIASGADLRPAFQSSYPVAV